MSALGVPRTAEHQGPVGSPPVPPPLRLTQGRRVIAWIEANCVHTNGQWHGLPFHLIKWQKQLIMELFEVGADGLRRYRWALIGVPKKNGKCLHPSTRVLLADGRQVPARQIQVGDLVASWRDGRIISAPVTAVEVQEPKELVAIETARGRRLMCTEDHPVLVRGGCQSKPGQRRATYPSWDANTGEVRWVPAGMLTPGERVVVAGSESDTQSTDRVVRVERLGPGDSIGIEVAGTHTHVTEGIVTHNTELAAALALYFLIADGEVSPLVVCAAASEEQADLVFGAAKTMCLESPTLSRITEVFEKEILVPTIPGAKLRRVAAAAGTNDGQNISAVICDELHEWAGAKGEAVWNVLTNGTGARTQPMVLQITTAGFDLEGSICGRQYTTCQQIQRGEIDDPRYYFHWVEAPEGADHRDPEVWKAANPSYGVLVQEDFFRDQLTKKTESVFRRYFLNQWVATEELWIPYGVWDQCASPLELDASLPLYVGIDIARSVDSSALVACQKQGERFVLRARIWSNPYAADHHLHDAWRMNNNLVMDVCRELFAEYPVAACEVDDEVKPGPMFAYDPWRFRPEAEMLSGEGLALVEFPQTDQRMVPASQAFFEAIMKTRVAHDGDAILKQHVQQVTADPRARGWRISKPKGSTRKIDAAIAAGIALYCCQTTTPPQEELSVYEDRGVIVIG